MQAPDGKQAPCLIIQEGAVQFRIGFDGDQAARLAQVLGEIIMQVADMAHKANNALIVPDTATVNKLNGNQQ